ncbi:hypothetical protein HO133_008609 [Letharia lupina]|uniref:Uncharacterized protein n=1 Tax=Letharia lupina TaxID=560253 RepID=A0A8H6FG10_9LECA|nr:uncharacterized protein HO133_008609 [Letharia lupina]KAF6227167.1 hypothetical protein HO133_008609 [Letharia lupina]
MPFLTLFSLQKSASEFQNSGPVPGLALRSLYVFRCRHHRHRPYTPASLIRKDSDSVHTHDLIKICYDLGIWTDTAWCPTPGGRCLKRKDYSVGRGTPDARTEVWVVYDRLWRSENRLGPAVYSEEARPRSTRGQLWEDTESGYNGEPLGCEPQQGHGEGKTQTTHLRQSHRKFIENIICQDCKAQIPERCEHCSIRMHCMGCRKTLCENCAFSRHLPPAKSPRSTISESGTGDETAKEPYWWAPGQMRNPNLMMQEVVPSNSAENSNTPNSTVTPALKMQWCCLKPMFSNGGSITFVGPGMTGSAINHVHTAPLPPGQGYEDAELSRLRQSHKTSGMRICGYKDLSTEKSFLEANSNFRKVLEASESSTVALNTAREKTKCTIREYLNVLSKLPELSRSFKDKYAHLLDSSQRAASDTLVLRPEVLLSEAAGELKETSYEGELLKMLGLIMSTPMSNTDDESTEPQLNNSWLGCGSFLCPKYRSIGDHRPRCTAAAQQCTLCEVHVCPDCLAQYSRCDCAYCKDHYSCPNCVTTLGSLCKKAEEEEEARRKIRIREERHAQWKHQLKEANDMAELARDFLARDILQSMPTVSQSATVTMHEEALARQNIGEAGG